jgi:hypothetical protein
MTPRKPAASADKDGATPDGDADFKDEVKPDNTKVPVGRPTEEK